MKPPFQFLFCMLCFFLIIRCSAQIQGKTITAQNRFTGKIYKSKSFFNFRYAPLFFKVERFSSWKYKTPNDTIVFTDFTIDSTIPKGTLKEKDTSVCYVTSDRGEQFKIPLSGKANVWMNASTEVGIRLLAGRVLDLKLRYGETYIESPQPITVYLSGSLKITSEAGSAFNVKNYEEEERLAISLAKGRISVTEREKDGHLSNIEIPFGNEICFGRNNTLESIHLCDIDKIGIWRNAGTFYFNDEDFLLTLLALKRWYKISVLYAKDTPGYKLTMTMPYKTPLDTALRYLSQVVPVTMLRIKGKIYVNHEVPPKNKSGR